MYLNLFIVRIADISMCLPIEDKKLRSMDFSKSFYHDKTDCATLTRQFSCVIPN